MDTLQWFSRALPSDLCLLTFDFTLVRFFFRFQATLEHHVENGVRRRRCREREAFLFMNCFGRLMMWIAIKMRTTRER